MPSKDLIDPCVDCNDAEAAIDVRRRRLCGNCFISYVHSKILKRLESYRLKKSNQDIVRKVLLPLSGGISSLVLLHIVDHQLRKQITQSRGRAAYELHVLVVESPLISSDPSSEFLAAVKERYPTHSFSSLSLSQISELDPSALDSITSSENGSSTETGSDSSNKIEAVLQSITSPTARADILDVLLTRLIVAAAKQKECYSIFWGHSDTRLAARALSSVAKGRGASVPFQVLDGPTPWGVTFNFPVRDLFKLELESFSKMDSTFPSDMIISETANPKPVSIREMSIDQLITNYITSQGEKYPSIMANVVRTAGKLHAPDMAEESRRCGLCGLLVEQGVPDQGSDTLCYGCLRSKESVHSR